MFFFVLQAPVGSPDRNSDPNMAAQTPPTTMKRKPAHREGGASAVQKKGHAIGPRSQPPRSTKTRAFDRIASNAKVLLQSEYAGEDNKRYELRPHKEDFAVCVCARVLSGGSVCRYAGH